MRPIPLHVLLLVMLAALAFASPAWCGAGEIRQLAVELDTAKNAIFLPGSSALRDKVLAEFAGKPPGPGWADWSESGLPSFSLAYDVLELLRAADILGFLDRRDATARKVLLEMAGRIRDTGREDARWLARTGRWIQASVSIPHAQDMVGNVREKSPEVRRLLARLKAALRAEALAGGPPPKGRPVLAEGYLPYLTLIRRVESLKPMARDLEARYGKTIKHDWPQRLRSARYWARWRCDILGMICSSDLTKASPKPALEFSRDFTGDDGWALEEIVESLCRPFDWKPPIPEKEQVVAQSVCALLTTFHDDMYEANLTLANRFWGWVPRH
ncbi:hypothetical protein [Fundidesulfovibrio terrae]|uniref:hypothetical protein n=1 Tax=Fundidesulfovibrio terrae TaxID=2922866 RepID=UPI001FAEE787|nr:hypothetical protein [Fundidesulfovibrio terrae]